MKNIKVLAKFSDAEKEMAAGKMKVVHQDEKNRFVFVNLKNGEKLAKHTSPHDLTVFTISGNGTIKAGKDLEEDLSLEAGMLFQIEKDVFHEVLAEAALKLLLVQTK